jgi:hypothetical protein
MGGVMTTADMLRFKRDAIYELQVEMLKLYCELDRAVDQAEAEAIAEEESHRLLREARRYLGQSVREVRP